MATKKILLLFILSRLFFLIVAILSRNFIKIDPGYLGSQVAQDEPPLIWSWANMDGRHFIKIATQGYSGTNYAYFPLYPLLINLLDKITPLTPILAGEFISLLSTLLAVRYLLKIIDFDKLKIGKTETLILLFFFPFSFILHSVYSDALFLFLTIAALFYARKSNWILSGVFAGLASLTRLSGLALFPALLVEWYLQKKPKKSFVAPLLGLFGFSLYPLYLQITTGNALLFQSSMRAWKQEKFVSVVQVFYRYLKIFSKVSRGLLVYWIAVLEFASFILYTWLGIYVWKKIRPTYGVFMIVSLSLVTFTGTFAGTPRYLIHLFPAFLGLALLLKQKPWFRYFYYPVTLILGILITAFFVQGYFVG